MEVTSVVLDDVLGTHKEVNKEGNYAVLQLDKTVLLCNKLVSYFVRNTERGTIEYIASNYPDAVRAAAGLNAAERQQLGEDRAKSSGIQIARADAVPNMR